MEFFPIFGGPAIPWAAIAPHEAQAVLNHDQSLEELAGRGGLSPSEAVAIMQDRSHRYMDISTAIDRLSELTAPFRVEKEVVHQIGDFPILALDPGTAAVLRADGAGDLVRAVREYLASRRAWKTRLEQPGFPDMAAVEAQAAAEEVLEGKMEECFHRLDVGATGSGGVPRLTRSSVASSSCRLAGPAWIRCPDCDGWLCLLHGMHVSDCSCPPIEEWESDPYGEVE